MIPHRSSFFATLVALSIAITSLALGQQGQSQQTILYGVAYYDEYTPVDRVDEDARMMKAAGISVVRIAESTWGTLEPQPGVFDFSHVDRMLAAMHKAGHQGDRRNAHLCDADMARAPASECARRPPRRSTRAIWHAGRTWTSPIPTTVLRPSG